MQDDSAPVAAPKVERRTDRNGINWTRFKGDDFWQTTEVKKVQQVQEKLDAEAGAKS